MFLSGSIHGVGFSSDGGTVVFVDGGSGENVVAFDSVSGWISSILVRRTWRKRGRGGGGGFWG